MSTVFAREIAEQPEVAARVVHGSSALDAAAAALRRLDPPVMLIAARGSSDHAGRYAKYLFGERNGLLVAAAAPSLSTMYRSSPRMKGACVVAISQSGESPDVLEVAAEARRQGALTLAITNSVTSPLALIADHVLDCQAGPELAVPASKTYTATLLVLALLSAALRPERGFSEAIASAPGALAAALTRRSAVASVAAVLGQRRLVVIGRGYHWCTAAEIALKLRETACLSAEYWSSAEYLHGPIGSLRAAQELLLLEARGPVLEQVREVGDRARRDGVPVAAITDEAASSRADQVVDASVGLPEALTPLVHAVIGQVLADELATRAGLDADSPRRLTKVTRTL